MSRGLTCLAVAGLAVLTACESSRVVPKADPATVPAVEKAKPPRPNHLGIDPYLFEQRRRMIAGQEIGERDLRALADTGDAYSIWNYAERLHARQDPALTFQVMEYYARAADKGRNGSIPRLIDIANSAAFADATPAQITRVEDVLRSYALEKQNTKAAFFLVQRYNVGTPFGDKSDQVVPLLETLAEGGDVDIALRLATEILGTPGASDNPEMREKARRYLEIARDAEDLSVRTTAQNLLVLMDRQDEMRADVFVAVETAPGPVEELAQAVEAETERPQNETEESEL